ncbi:hypothetical protein AGMMS49546_33000 [Spirochaetia bacterium]|nr:hypothetical protein AGMMS49546_33000 [Spirochaetia bacterium]
MGILTSQKISAFYERFKGIDVTYTKEVIQVTGLQANQVHLKCVSDFWPCVIYSSSFSGAKIVANIKSGLVDKLQQANNSVSLRFCFKVPGEANPLTFFVSARSVDYASYGGSKDMALFNIQFTQRPPDDLIEIMGRLLDANFNSVKRREERIPVTAETQRKMGILSNESAIFIQGVPRRCILRDISFSGAKLIMMGIIKFLEGKEASLRLDFEDPRESFLIKGKFAQVENVEARKDLLALMLAYDESIVPMGYKMRVNDFLGTVRAENRTGDSDSADASSGAAKTVKAKPAAEAPAKPAAAAVPDADPAAPGLSPAGAQNAEAPPEPPAAKAGASQAPDKAAPAQPGASAAVAKPGAPAPAASTAAKPGAPAPGAPSAAAKPSAAKPGAVPAATAKIVSPSSGGGKA